MNHKTTIALTIVLFAINCSRNNAMIYNKITIQPLDLDNVEFKGKLCDSLEKIFEVPVNFSSPERVPKDSYNDDRDQYLSTRVIRKLARGKDEHKSLVLGMTSEDLYVPRLNFVFGQASSSAGIAVISTRRLKNSFYNQSPNESLLQKRILTESVHEIGHVLGLAHCSNLECVMHFSNSLKDTDRKGYNFCDECKKEIKEVLK